MTRDELMQQAVQSVLLARHSGVQRHKEAMEEAQRVLTVERYQIKSLPPTAADYDERTTACRAVEDFLVAEELRLQRLTGR